MTWETDKGSLSVPSLLTMEVSKWVGTCLLLATLCLTLEGAPSLDNESVDPALPQNVLGTGQVYRLDYKAFLKKLDSTSRRRRRRGIQARLTDSLTIESIDLKLNWQELLTGGRLGTALIMKRNDKFVEYAILYAPKDGSYTVRNLFDATGYASEIRVLRDKQELASINTTNPKDTVTFKVDTPRVVSESESKEILSALAKLQKGNINLESVSVSLKIPKQKSSFVLEVSSLKEKTAPRALVHVFPRTVSVIVNDLPPHDVVKLMFRPINATLINENVYSAFLFTGSLTLSNHKVPVESASRIAVYGNSAQLGGGGGGSRKTVTCYVEKKPPFQGFPCKDTNVCIPLHWECDGEDDCQDGHDELSCGGGLSSYSGFGLGDKNNYGNNNYSPSQRCRRNEFECISREVRVCLPVSWMCDGRTDCSDGWDEDKDNCRRHSQYPGYGSNNYPHHQRPSRCQKNYFRCKRGGCVAPKLVCDGHRDCSDGSDEFDCYDDEDDDLDNEDDCDEDHEFKCFRSHKHRKCIPQPWVCDDQDDCPSGEDEYSDFCNGNGYDNN